MALMPARNRCWPRRISRTSCRCSRKSESRKSRTPRSAPPATPIRVISHRMNVDEKLSQAQHTEGAIEEQFHKEFASDQIIRIVDPVVAKPNELTQVFDLLAGKTPTKAASAGPMADVEVVTRAYVEEKAGYNKTSKKFGTYARSCTRRR